ncbi:MAG: hypothetical protein COB53_12660 [Elusimicrobia bacterium]|nr:MAG: hypothetical protein COB53_12660 [Elusimicrobiota bacterium]
MVLAACLVAGTSRGFAHDVNRLEEPGVVKNAPLHPVLVESLSAIRAERLAGLFGFVQPRKSALAFASLLQADHSSMKRFLKFSKERFVAAGVITAWEKLVMLQMVTINSGNYFPKGMERASSKLISQMSELALVGGVSAEMFRQRRMAGGRR